MLMTCVIDKSLFCLCCGGWRWLA